MPYPHVSPKFRPVLTLAPIRGALVSKLRVLMLTARPALCPGNGGSYSSQLVRGSFLFLVASEMAPEEPPLLVLVFCVSPSP